MGVDVVTDIDIGRSAADVAAYATDPDNAPQWYANIASATWAGETGLDVGTEVAFVARFMGRRMEYTYEVVEYDPGRRLVMRTSDGPFPMETTYT
ncbi:MAG: SRPBCC family protein, partial [Microthrixaceae bacterium]